MTSIVSIYATTVQKVLGANNLGSGILLEESDELRIFLDIEPTAVLAAHFATSELEIATGRVVQLELKSSLGPTQQAQLERIGTPV